MKMCKYYHTIFVHVWKVYLITEENEPFVELYRREDHAIWCATELTVVVKCFQQQFWGGSTTEVQANHLDNR